MTEFDLLVTEVVKTIFRNRVFLYKLWLDEHYYLPGGGLN